MPYLAPKVRESADAGLPPVTAGELTYALQQQLARFLHYRGLSYQTLAECLGSLEGCKADLLERVVKPYEAEKREDNGDVWPQRMSSHANIDERE